MSIHSERGPAMIAPPFTPEHDLFRQNLRTYVERELAPHALEWDEAGIFPREVFRGLAELGALGVNYPEEVGGSGGDYWHVVVLGGVPVRYLLGEEDAGFYHIMTNFQGERLVASIGAVAGMQQMVEDAIRYGNERGAFGKPLVKFQVWRHKLVEHLTSIEAARWLTYRACDLFARKEPAVKEISMSKLFAGDLMQRVVYDCMQLHGGMGYVVETPIARAFRDVRLLTIGGATRET